MHRNPLISLSESAFLAAIIRPPLKKQEWGSGSSCGGSVCSDLRPERCGAALEQVIRLYQHHGMHEQFHSDIKTDLDLERLPSDKFDTNDAILRLAGLTYNCLRRLGQLGLTGPIAPTRHPASPSWLKTVLQEIMYRATNVVEHARRPVRDFGRGVAAYVQAFVDLQPRLFAAASP